MPKTHKQAIVTLALGARHQALWHRHCAESWKHYGDRHGYDVICLEHPLDTSPRARQRYPSWQKLLVLDQPFARRYERIIWIDADVLINPAAPPITDGVPVERVGAANEFACPTADEYPPILTKLFRHWQLSGSGFIRNPTAREFYAVSDLPPAFDAVASDAVMVLSPRHHRDLLAGVYWDYDFGYKGSGWNLEMRALSYELLTAGCVEWIDPRFNYVWLDYRALHFPFLLTRPDHPRAVDAATIALQDVYCLHFAGEMDQIGLPRIESHVARRTHPNHIPRPPHRLNTPVVMFTSAEQKSTRQAVDAMRFVKPRCVLVVGAPASAVEIDWDCDVRTLGLAESRDDGQLMQAGLEWAFSLFEEAVILEAGCRPEPTFFGFCQELLAIHRDDRRVTAINGVDFTSDPAGRPDHYRYTSYPMRWGWATWRRAWELHDPAMTRWPRLRQAGWLEGFLSDHAAAAYWSRRFDRAQAGSGSRHDSWVLTCWLHGGVCAAPEVNLVEFALEHEPDAIDITDPESAVTLFTNMPTRSATFPLVAPARVEADVDHDAFLEDVAFSGNFSRLLARIRVARREQTR